MRPVLKKLSRLRPAGWLAAAFFLLVVVQGNAAQTLACPTLEASKDKPFVNSLGQKFVRLPGTNVLLCIWEARVQDFETFLAANAIKESPLPRGLTPTQPACNVNWHEAVTFCRWLTRAEQKLGLIGAADRYRLPSDAEWSLAVGPTRFPWGDKWPPPEPGPNSPGYQPGDGANTAPVGSCPPNALGIHDLAGNAFEWVLDWYDRKMNPVEIRLEYKRLEDDGGGRTYKVLRGAPWIFRDPMNLLSSYRYVNAPDKRGGLYGFRVALEVEGKRPAASVKSVVAKTAAAGPVAKASASVVRGRQLLAGRCTECHQIFDPTPYDAESWSRLISSMSGKAKLRGGDAGDLDAFISTVRTGQK
ncbi:MAG: SUMF1/EgtB/PvdO family nonheme iron enzyme [Verrucomicrobia bacterium]|nr:SUMF1/EgtB/PvdO family nonheme iron enzyme [Verrucomicrobiota bacterium]